MARGMPCDCEFPDFCDSQNGELPPTRLAGLQQTSLPASDTASYALGAMESNVAFSESKQSETDDAKVTSTALSPQQLENEYVHRVYDKIAQHFSATR